MASPQNTTEINIKTNVDSTSAIKEIDNFNKAIDGISGVVSSMEDETVSSFNNVGDVVVSNITNSNESLDVFQKALNDFSVDAFKDEIDTTKDSLDDMSDMLDKINELGAETEKALSKTSDEIEDIADSSNSAKKGLQNVAKGMDDLEKKSKAGSLALEALKDNLGSIPVVGQTLSRALDGIEGSFIGIAKAAAPIAGISAGIVALAGVIYGAYQNSEDFRNSLKRTAENGIVALSPLTSTLENIGDAIAYVLDGLNEWFEKVNAVSGATAKSAQNLAKEALDELNNISKSASEQIDVLKMLAGNTIDISKEVEEITKRAYENIKESAVNNIDDLVKEEQKLMIAKRLSYDAMIEAEEKWKKSQKDVFEVSSGVTAELEAEFRKLEKVHNDNLKAIADNALAQSTLKTKYQQSALELENLSEKTDTAVKSQNNFKTSIESTNKTDLEKLEETLNTIIVETERSVKLIENSSDTEEEKIQKIKDLRISALNTQKSALESFYKTNGDEYWDAEVKNIAKVDAETGKLVGSVEKLSDGYKSLEDGIKSLSDKSKKSFEDMVAGIQSVLGGFSSLTDSIISGISSIFTTSKENYYEYDEAIREANQELLDYQNSIREEQEEQDDEDYNLKMERLQEELDKAIKAQDAMAENAIRDKMNELKAEQNKKKEEDKIAKEEAKREEELNKKIAQAEYQKELAVWNNQVKNAETQKNLAIAQAVSQSAFGIAMAGVGTATSFAQGGLVGAAAGAVLAATIISSIMGAVAGINSAVSEYDNVKSNPPQPPQFAIGTAGYTLGSGESAIVGENGAELVRNMGGGRIAVDTASQTAYSGYSNGNTYNFYVSITDSYIKDKEDFLEKLSAIKQSELETFR